MNVLNFPFKTLKALTYLHTKLTDFNSNFLIGILGVFQDLTPGAPVAHGVLAWQLDRVLVDIFAVGAQESAAVVDYLKKKIN